MKKQRIRTILILLFVLPTVVWAVQGRGSIFRKSLPAKNVSEVKTDISFFAGELYMYAHSEKLAECFYGYKDLYIEPFMQYRQVDRVGYLSVKCKRKNKEQLDNSSNANKWKLGIHPKIRYDLAVEVMAGKAHLDLQGARLTGFEYKMTAGESTIVLRNTSVPKVQCELMAGECSLDLTGVWKNDCEATIKGGVGEINLKVPFKTGVKIRVSGLLGEVDIPFFNREGRTYTNDSWGKTKHCITIDVSGAVGRINVELAD